MESQNRTLWLVIGLLGGLIVCMVVVLGLYFGVVQPQQSDSVELTETVIAQETVQIPPTYTPIDQPTATQIEIVVTPTPSSGVLEITANLTTNCRQGPSTDYDIVGYLETGQKSEVEGTNESQSWWYIKNLNIPGEYCWVWGETTNVNGDTSGLPVVQPPAPPPAKAGFTVSLAEINKCYGIENGYFQITNTGATSLKSLTVMVVDLTENDTLYWLPSHSTPFLPSVEDCPPYGVSELEVGSIAYVATELGFPVPYTHEIRATFKICSEDDLKGSCHQEVLEFTMPLP
jgi:SH3-like domain-containing protein